MWSPSTITLLWATLAVVISLCDSGPSKHGKKAVHQYRFQNATSVTQPLDDSPSSECSNTPFPANEATSRCSSFTSSLVGLTRGGNFIESGYCCPHSDMFRYNAYTFMVADWVDSFDRNNRWNKCPMGFFLHGFYRSNNGVKLGNIEHGMCSKPANHPYSYGVCYDEDVSSSFDRSGLSKCRNGYFLVGFYRGSCDSINCIEKFKCCQMSSSVPDLQSLADVKTRTMDTTLENLAFLAFYLGYGWCLGCRADYAGEDFKRNGDSWEAVYTTRSNSCPGYMSDKRLKIHYGDFKFSIKDIKFGERQIDEMVPVVVDSGKFTNDHDQPKKVQITRDYSYARTVTHTTTSSWKAAHELGVEISYSPPPTGGVGAKASYKFNYENAQSTTDSTANQQSSSFKVTSETEIPPGDTIDWQLVLSKTRSTVSYTATILAHCSVELDGFLRWGGGPNGDTTNFHYEKRGSDDRPNFKYKMGDSSKPFYKVLRLDSSENKRPWEWSEMMGRYEPAEGVINSLTDEYWYEFTLTGTFEDISGQNADIQWSKGSKDESTNESTEKKDPPRVFPPPPVVKIKLPVFKLPQKIKVSKEDPQ